MLFFVCSSSSKSQSAYLPHSYHQPGPCAECLVAQSCPTLFKPTRLLCPWDSPGKNTGVGCHVLLQAIFPIQGSNSGLLHCRWILYCRATRETRWLAPRACKFAALPWFYTRIRHVRVQLCSVHF